MERCLKYNRTRMIYFAKTTFKGITLEINLVLIGYFTPLFMLRLLFL